MVLAAETSVVVAADVVSVDDGVVAAAATAVSEEANAATVVGADDRVSDVESKAKTPLVELADSDKVLEKLSEAEVVSLSI